MCLTNRERLIKGRVGEVTRYALNAVKYFVTSSKQVVSLADRQTTGGIRKKGN